MKNALLMVLLMIGITQGLCQEKVTVQKGDSVSLKYDEFEANLVEIQNSTKQGFEINVRDEVTHEWIKGFGLGPKAKAVVDVRSGQLLIFTNNSKKEVEVELNFVKRKAPEVKTETMITFTLRNSTSKSIPLIIPDVMNPNLTPFSSSGVSLKIGQEIYYKRKGKTVLLFVVDDKITNGAKIDVAELIDQLEKEK